MVRSYTNLLSLSSLQEIAQISLTHVDLVMEHTTKVIMHGGNSILEKGNLVMDDNIANNRFDMVVAVEWHSFIQSNVLPSKTYSKLLAFTILFNSKFFENINATGHPMGANMCRIQVE